MPCNNAGPYGLCIKHSSGCLFWLPISWTGLHTCQHTCQHPRTDTERLQNRPASAGGTNIKHEWHGLAAALCRAGCSLALRALGHELGNVPTSAEAKQPLMNRSEHNLLYLFQSLWQLREYHAPLQDVTHFEPWIPCAQPVKWHTILHGPILPSMLAGVGQRNDETFAP